MACYAYITTQKNIDLNMINIIVLNKSFS